MSLDDTTLSDAHDNADPADTPEPAQAQPYTGPEMTSSQRGTVYMTTATMGAELLAAVLDEMKAMPDCWAKMNKSKQQQVIYRLRQRIRDLTVDAVNAFTAEGREALSGKLIHAKIKDGVQTQVEFSQNIVDLQKLFEHVGGNVMVVIGPALDFDSMWKIEAEADQRALELGQEYAEADGAGVEGTSTNPIGHLSASEQASIRSIPKLYEVIVKTGAGSAIARVTDDGKKVSLFSKDGEFLIPPEQEDEDPMAGGSIAGMAPDAEQRTEAQQAAADDAAANPLPQADEQAVPGGEAALPKTVAVKKGTKVKNSTR